MKEDKNIEQIFKDAFSNFEVPVDSSLWQGIENSLPANPTPLTKVSFLAKQAAYLKITGAVIAVATAVTAVLYFSNKNEKGTVQNAVHINNETAKAVEVATQKSVKQTTETTSKSEKINTPEEPKTKKPAIVTHLIRLSNQTKLLKINLLRLILFRLLKWRQLYSNHRQINK